MISMTALHRRLGLPAAVLLLLAARAHCRSTYQFQRFYPSWSHQLTTILDNDCVTERDAYNDASNNDRLISFNLTSCVLQHLAEFTKTEISVVSVIFGLLPTMLMLIGPTTDEISLLGRRRSLLAGLLALAMPSVRSATESPYQDPGRYLREPVDITSRVGILSRPSLWARGLVSLAQYALATGAAANMVYQSYLMATQCVSVSAIAIYSEPLPQTYGPFLWFVLIVVVHLIGGLASSLATVKDPENERRWHRKTARWSLLQWLADELTPCCYADPVFLVRRPRTYLSLFVSYLSQLAVVVLFGYATIMLSSQIFISLGDAVPVIAYYMVGAYVSRLLLTMELHGMREVTSAAVERSLTGSTEKWNIDGRCG